MRLIGRMHGTMVYGRRVRALSGLVAASMPANARVLDVGCGDGLIDCLIVQKRPDVRIRGLDVLVRDELHIPVERFDGRHIPYGRGEFDVVMFIDVLHHTDDPTVLLREADRVTAGGVLIKDHDANGRLAKPTLRLMDWVGNAHHGVSLPYNYWPKRQWLDAFESLGLSVRTWTHEVGLYLWWADAVFGRSLHFVCLLGKEGEVDD